MSEPTIRVAVTGAAGQIGYQLAFAVASGALLGPGTAVSLRLLELPERMRRLESVAMEVQDCAYGPVRAVEPTDDPEVAFAGAEIVFLVGAAVRTADMRRADLLERNYDIFRRHGAALDRAAAEHVRVLVVGNPANTNALIVHRHAPGLGADRIAAMTRLDHNRTVGALAARAGVSAAEVRRVAVWGNHSSSLYPDVRHATVAGAAAITTAEDERWVRDRLIPTVAERGAAILRARGTGSTASAAQAAVDCVRDWIRGTPDGDWTSAAVVSAGQYGVPAGLVCSYPVVARAGRWEVVDGLRLDGTGRARLAASIGELGDEHRRAAALGLPAAAGVRPKTLT